MAKILTKGTNACSSSISIGNISKEALEAITSDMKFQLDYIMAPKAEWAPSLDEKEKKTNKIKAKLHDNILSALEKDMLEEFLSNPTEWSSVDYVNTVKAYLSRVLNPETRMTMHRIEDLDVAALRNIGGRIWKLIQLRKRMRKTGKPDWYDQFLKQPLIVSTVIGSSATNIVKKLMTLHERASGRKVASSKESQDVLGEFRLSLGGFIRKAPPDTLHEMLLEPLTEIELDAMPNDKTKRITYMSEILTGQYEKFLNKMMDGRVMQVSVEYNAKENLRNKKDLPREEGKEGTSLWERVQSIYSGTEPMSRAKKEEQGGYDMSNTLDFTDKSGKRIQFAIVYDNREDSVTSGRHILIPMRIYPAEKKGRIIRLLYNPKSKEELAKITDMPKLLDDSWIESEEYTFGDARFPSRYTNYKQLELQPYKPFEKRMRKSMMSMNHIFFGLYEKFKANIDTTSVEFEYQIRETIKYFSEVYGMDEASARDELNKILEKEGIGSGAFVDFENNLRVGFGKFRRIRGFVANPNLPGKYFPQQYSKTTRLNAYMNALESMGVEREDLMEQLSEVESELQTTQAKTKKLNLDVKRYEIESRIESIEEDLLNIETLLRALIEPTTPDTQVKVKLASQALFTRKRQGIMNPMDRILDWGEMDKYMYTTFRQIELNSIKALFLKAARTVTTEQFQWLANRLKVSMYMSDLNFDNVPNSDFILPKTYIKQLRKLGLAKNWTDDSVLKWSQIIKGAATGNVLGVGPTITNKFQTVHDMIYLDADMRKEIDKMFEDLRPEAKRKGFSSYQEYISKMAGTTDFIDVWSGMLLGGTSDKLTNWSKMKGYGHILKIFMTKAMGQDGNLKKMYKLLWKNDNEVYPIDSVIAALSFSQEKSEDMAYLKKLITTDKFKKRRMQFLEILGSPMKGEKETLRQQKLMRDFFTDAIQDRVNMIVNWKLTHNVIGSLKGFKGWTFTSAEQELRKNSTAYAVGYAYLTNMIGDMTSKEALEYAQEYVNKTMFGLSPSHLPFIFAGVGTLGFQFKQFPYHQTIEEIRIWSNFLSSVKDPELENMSLEEEASIVADALSKMPTDEKNGKRWWKEMFTSKSKQSKTLRKWLVGKLMPSLGIILAEISTDFASSVYYITQRLFVGRYAHRAAESFMITLPLRAFSLFYILLFHDDDKDKENLIRKLGRGIVYQLLSPMFGFMAALSYNIMLSLSNEEVEKEPMQRALDTFKPYNPVDFPARVLLGQEERGLFTKLFEGVKKGVEGALR